MKRIKILLLIIIVILVIFIGYIVISKSNNNPDLIDSLSKNSIPHQKVESIFEENYDLEIIDKSQIAYLDNFYEIFSPRYLHLDELEDIDKDLNNAWQNPIDLEEQLSKSAFKDNLQYLLSQNKIILSKDNLLLITTSKKGTVEKYNEVTINFVDSNGKISTLENKHGNWEINKAFWKDNDTLILELSTNSRFVLGDDKVLKNNIIFFEIKTDQKKRINMPNSIPDYRNHLIKIYKTNEGLKILSSWYGFNFETTEINPKDYLSVAYKDTELYFIQNKWLYHIDILKKKLEKIEIISPAGVNIDNYNLSGVSMPRTADKIHGYIYVTIHTGTEINIDSEEEVPGGFAFINLQSGQLYKPFIGHLLGDKEKDISFIDFINNEHFLGSTYEEDPLEANHFISLLKIYDFKGKEIKSIIIGKDKNFNVFKIKNDSTGNFIYFETTKIITNEYEQPEVEKYRFNKTTLEVENLPK